MPAAVAALSVMATLATTTVLSSPAAAVPGKAHGKPSPSADSAVIQRDAVGNLTLNGEAYRFTGVNAYELATQWSVNAGCGSQIDDLDGFFSNLRPNSLVRFWAYQSMGINKYTKEVDWTGLDRVFASAAKYNQRLIPTLADQWGTCDAGHWKDTAWYNGDYNKAFNDDGTGNSPLSFSAWVDRVVPRYANSPALGMWELVNEPEGTDCAAGYFGQGCWGHTTCVEADAASALRSFFDTEAVRVKALDPQHLVAAGFIGAGQCGTQGGNYQTVGGSPGIDVLTVHDYGSDAVALSGDQWNGIAVRITQAQNLNKPIFTEEVGTSATGFGPCVNVTVRSALLQSKLTGQLLAGLSGFLPWNWTPLPSATCSLDMAPGDPTLAMLATVAL